MLQSLETPTHGYKEPENHGNKIPLPYPFDKSAAFASPGDNLFVFPYDWRKDLTEVAHNLRLAMDWIKAKTGRSRVDIIAHSMGGLVARYCINVLSSCSGSIRKLIMLGVPQHGAPLAYEAVNSEIGECFPFLIFACPFRSTNIPGNLPSAYQLLPTKRFFSSYNNYIFEDDFADPNNPANVKQGKIMGFASTYLRSFPDGELSNPNLMLQANDFFNRMGDTLGSFAHPFNGEAFIFVGSGQATHLHIIKGKRCSNLLAGVIFQLECFPGQSWDVTPTNGDGTVPLLSAAILNLVGHGTKCVSLVNSDHLGLAQKPEVLDAIKAILNSNADCQIIQAMNGIQIGAFDLKDYSEIHIKSPVIMRIFDKNGNLIGPDKITGLIQQTSGSSYSFLGEDTIAFLKDTAGPYRIELQATSAGDFILELTRYAGDQAVTKINYGAIRITAQSKATLLFDPASNTPAPILLDFNGDGTVDQEILPGQTESKPSIPIPTPKLISPHATRAIAEDATQPGDAGILTEGETRWVVLQRLDICNGGFMAVRVPPEPPAHPTSYPSCEPFPSAVGPDPLLINILQVWRLAGHVSPGVKIPLRLCIDRNGDQRCGPGEALQELQADFSGNQPNVFGSFGKLLVDPGMGIPGLAPSNQGILGVGTSPQGVCPAGSTFAGKPCGVELIIEGNFAKAPSGTSLQIESWPMEQPLPDQGLNYSSQFVPVDIPNMNVHIAYPVVSAGVVRVIKRPSGQGQAPLIKQVRMQENSPAGPLGVEVEGRNIQSVRLEVFDLAGDRRYASAWTVGNRLTWNRLMSNGKPLANGVYLYLVEVRGYNGKIITSKVKKLVLLR